MLYSILLQELNVYQNKKISVFIQNKLIQFYTTVGQQDFHIEMLEIDLFELLYLVLRHPLLTQDIILIIQ